MPEIEQINYTIKEKVLITYNEIKRHLTKLAGVITIYMVYATVLWINSFTFDERIYRIISP